MPDAAPCDSQNVCSLNMHKVHFCELLCYVLERQKILGFYDLESINFVLHLLPGLRDAANLIDSGVLPSCATYA